MMLRKSGKVFIAFLLISLAGSAGSLAKKPQLPPDAQAVLKDVASAARAKDWNALRTSMVPEFTWSFGDDPSADTALAEWKTDPRFLRELVRVLARGCRMKDPEHVECPGRGGMAPRAGFVKNADRWRLEYFVEGD